MLGCGGLFVCFGFASVASVVFFGVVLLFSCLLSCVVSVVFLFGLFACCLVGVCLRSLVWC